MLSLSHQPGYGRVGGVDGLGVLGGEGKVPPQTPDL